MPALPLFSQLRRYTLAVIAAAETAADFAAVIQSNEPADSGAELTTLDTFELERRMATVLPEGYQLGQIKAEQPTTTYGDFKKEIITEIARCLSVPYNVAAGDSSKYNYASGRLDHQVYWKMLDVERSEVELKILKPFFRLWLQLFLAERSGIAPQDIDVTQYVCAFFWPGREHVDPKKEADAQSIKLKNGTTNLQREQGKMGYDYETEMRQTQKEALLKMEFELQMVAAKKKLMQSLGLTPEDIEPDPKKPKPPEKDGRSRKTAGVAVSA
jgi:capsid protein